MYLSELDVIATTIALVSLMALVITSAVANARMTRQRDEWRSEALRFKNMLDQASPTLRGRN